MKITPIPVVSTTHIQHNLQSDNCLDSRLLEQGNYSTFIKKYKILLID